jgi:hypothetical protein
MESSAPLSVRDSQLKLSPHVLAARAKARLWPMRPRTMVSWRALALTAP